MYICYSRFKYVTYLEVATYIYVYCVNLYLAVDKPSRPEVVLSNQSIQLTVNDETLLINCLPHDTNFSYMWERKYMKLPSTAQGINSEQLTITSLKPKDSGEYRCIMSNSTGMIASDYVIITIKGLWIDTYVICYCKRMICIDVILLKDLESLLKPKLKLL